MTLRCRFRLGLLGVAVASAACLGEGDDAGDAASQTELDNRDQTSVYVGDSYEARTILLRADRFAATKRWREAAQTYHQLVEQHPDKLIRLDAHAFVGTAECVNRRISAWPDDGIKIYRLLYADHAREQLTRAEAAGDLSGLLTVAETYFCTRQGAIAADLAGQLAMEAGDFALARRLYEQLLERHPDRKSLAGEPATKLALSFVWSGQTQRARALLESIKKDHPAATLLWAGRRRPSAEIVEEAIARRVEPAVDERRAAWPLVGGSPQGDAVAVCDVQVGAPLWEFGPDEGFTPRRARQEPRRTQFRANRLRQISQDLTIVPVTDGERLYFNDGNALWAIQAADGQPVWPAYSVAQLASGLGSTQSLTEPSLLHTCTLHDGRLYAVLGQTDAVVRGRQDRATGVLVCVDAATGKAVWTTRLAELGSDLDDVWLDSAPVCSQGRMYAVGRRRKRFGFEDCYLICFDRATGEVVWSRHLASATVGSYGLRRATLTFPVVSEATVFVCTNLGAIAAVNAQTGRTRWLRIYHKDSAEEQAGERFARQALPWRYAPPICWRDNLICSPLDSEYVVVVRRADGEVIGRIGAEQLSRFSAVLGVTDDVLYVVGREVVAWDLLENQERWSRSIADTGGGPLGRGQLTRSHIYLPMINGLYRYALKGGRPVGFEWPEDGVGGNLLALRDQVVVAGHDRITGYAPKDEAFARLQRRIDAAPNDPVPLLDLAELAHRVGERARGIDALNRAVEIAGGFARLADPALKARVFRDFVRFGDKALDEEPPDETRALMLYQQAAQCPPDLDARVLYRLRLAETYAAASRFDRAVEQYQQIVEDQSLRERTAQPRGSDETWPAGRWSEQQIDAILADRGRAPYEAVERRARDMLVIARDQADLSAIQRVIDGYPNSLSARQALLAKAELLEKRDDYRQAVRAYLQLLQRSPKRRDAPDVIRRIAQAYLRSNRPAAASRWMARGARMFPAYRFDHDGQSIGFEQYGVLTAKDAAIVQRLPRFSLPLSKRWSRKFPGWVTVLAPDRPDLLTTRWDLYLTHCDGRIEAFSAPSGERMWTSPVTCRSRPSLLGMTQRRLVLTTRRRLMGLDIDSGAVAWSVEAYSADADGPEVDPEALGKWTTWTMTEDRVFAVRNDRQAVCIDPGPGRVIWQGRLAEGSGSQPVANEEFFVYEVMSRNQQQTFLHVLDAETGREIRKIKTGDLGRTFWLQLSPQGLLLAAASRQLFAFDPYTGTLAWKDELAFHNLRATLLPGSGSLYLSHNGRTFVRRSIETGRVLAESSSLVGGLTSGGVPALDGDRLFVLTPQAVTALDSSSLTTLWCGVTDRRENVVQLQVGQPFVVAVGQRRVMVAQEGQPGRRYSAYFYDRRDDSGMLNPDGGYVDLGAYQNPGGPYVADHTLLIAERDVLYGWTGPGR